MPTPARWLLIIVLGLQAHLILLALQIAALSPFQNQPAIRAGVVPFGQLNYGEMSAIALIEWVFLLLLWGVFAVFLLRRSPE